MPEAEGDPPLRILLDQNVPRQIGAWLRERRPDWSVIHTSEVELQGREDQEVFGWAQRNGHIIVTFDEDFADQRSFPVGKHHGVVRLRIWPTTVEETMRALARLIHQVDERQLRGALVIVGRHHIRVRGFYPLVERTQ